MSYRISTVAEMTGIPRNTLIAWERRYGLVRPPRQDNGYRYYSDDDVGQLLRIKNAINAGLKISEAVGLVKSSGESGVVAAPQKALAEGEESPYVTIRERLLAALIDYRGEDARRILSDLVNVPFSTKLHQVYFPVLRAVGDKWEAGEISVAQEHFASGIIRTHLAALFVTTAQQPLHAPHAACTTLPHDEHEIGALALSIQLSLHGYRVSYLGSKLPLVDLQGFIAKQQPKLVCVSCITLPEPSTLRAYVSGLNSVASSGVRVVLGGASLAGLTLENAENLEIYPDWSDFIR